MRKIFSHRTYIIVLFFLITINSVAIISPQFNEEGFNYVVNIGDSKEYVYSKILGLERTEVFPDQNGNLIEIEIKQNSKFKVFFSNVSGSGEFERTMTQTEIGGLRTQEVRSDYIIKTTQNISLWEDTDKNQFMQSRTYNSTLVGDYLELYQSFNAGEFNLLRKTTFNIKNGWMESESLIRIYDNGSNIIEVEIQSINQSFISELQNLVFNLVGFAFITGISFTIGATIAIAIKRKKI